MRDIFDQVVEFLKTPAATIALIIMLIWIFLYSRLFRKQLMTENYYLRLFISGMAVVSSAFIYLFCFFFFRSVIN